MKENTDNKNTKEESSEKEIILPPGISKRMIDSDKSKSKPPSNDNTQNNKTKQQNNKTKQQNN
ncbi:MAG: hypothetical protein ACOYEC_02510, partial [Christensenellales bacterium]